MASPVALVPLLLITLAVAAETVEGRKMKMSDFSFTAPLYNFSFVENGRSVAKCDDLLRPGVPLLSDCKSVEFRVIGGDADSNGVSSKDRFESSSHRVGNFVFLNIEQRKGQQPLNRELKSQYSLLVRAQCTKRDSSKQETTTSVAIRVMDVNDAGPLPELDLVEVSIDAQSPPFTRVTCISASDADASINGEVVFSLAERSQEYTMEPLTGCIRTLRSPLRHNSTTLKVRIEDRASRLFYYDEKTRVEATTMEVKISVVDRRRDRLNVLVEKRPVDRGEEAREGMQIAALLRVEEERSEEREKEPKYEVVIVDEHGSGGLFQVRRETATSWTLLTRPRMPIPERPKVVIRAGSDSAHDTNTTAEITVETVELHNITFDEPKYEVHVSEDMAIGRPIGRIEATVVRREDKKLLKYRIEKTDEGDLPFSIDEESGRIRVTEWLDYEMKTEYSFNVMAKLTGYGHQSMTSVTVHVSDHNDHNPTFPVKLARLPSIAIPKDAKQGFSLVNVSTVDRDSGDNGRVLYRLVSLSPSRGEPPFTIDPESGNICLGRLSSLSPNESSWMVGVVASDRGIPPRSSQLVLAFHRNGTKPLKMPDARVMGNANENAPILLDEEESFEVDEDVQIGEIIGRIGARDDDSSYSASLRFATLDHHIDIDDNGTIMVARSLSELLPSGKEEILHPFTVTVYDRGNPVKSSERQYAVRIRGVNNHAPVFDKPWYRIQVPENTPVGTVMLSVSATDEDGGDNGRVRYELAGWNTVVDADGSLITVDEKGGEITLNGVLDREEAESHRLTIMAYDGGSPSRIAFANLTIEVEDINDNTPRCAHQVTKMAINEDWPDGALVGCIAVHDEDSGANGRLVYAMEMDKMQNGEPFPFRVDRHSGCVFVKSKHPLDYEKRSSYNLSIEVSDNGETPLTTICQMDIHLIDVNENRYPPVFEDTVLEASVYENEAIGTLVINLVVSDADGSGNATLTIEGGDGRAAFTVVGGDVRTAEVLDRERKADYWITVRATDNAPVPLSSHLFIYIRVLDRSDHSPIFKQPFYTAHVIENAAPDTVVVKVEAEDADWPPSGKPAQLRYAITSGDPQSFFAMDPLTGYLTTGGTRKLDRETQKMHELEVRVTTADEKEMNTGVVRVFVSITDMNDHDPIFVHANKHEYEVPAGRKGRLCRIVAYDADEGVNAELHFTLKTLEPGFTIDSEGFIETTKELKDGQVSTLDVLVRDGGDPPRETSRRIVLSAVKMDAVETENNHAPKFAQADTYKFDVSDADQVGTPIGILSATDDDGHRLWWSIVPDDSSNYSSYFDINPRTGYLILAQPIDRLPQEINKIRLVVRATDGKAETDARVRIQLARQPISRPLFEKTNYEITLSEKTPIGTSILSPVVKGYGSRPIEYSIHSTESARAATTIGVDPSSGHVMLIGSLDYEAERRFRIVLSAKQGSLIGYSMLTVTVSDENDSAPLFNLLEYEVTVASNISTGTVVATVTAFDSDEGENGLIVYDIMSGNELGFFSIDRESGEIRTTKEMEHSAHYESILTVRASDRGGETGALTALTTVRVRTTDGQGQPTLPVFERSLYHLSVRENTPVGRLLLAVRAASPDGHIRYETAKKCSWVEVHPVSGAIRLKRWLTRARSKSINCTIVARGTGEGEATTKLVLRIIATNENAPIFRQQIYRGRVRENATGGLAVQSESGGALVVSATDKDTGTNALIGYRLLTDDPYFTVDLLAGTIRTRIPLDYERLREWRLHVTAHDMGHPPRYSALPALVVVEVVDENDCAPTFATPSIDVDLVLPSVEGVRLATIHASDVDTVGEIRYYLRGEEGGEGGRGLFRVEADTGDLLLLTADRKNFTEKSYKLDVLATDGVHSASQEVRIRVKNASQSDLRFSQSVYVATLEESPSFPSPVSLITVQASLVSDPSEDVYYSLLTTRGDFSILPSTGLISFIGESIDREERDHVLLLVQARASRSQQTTQCIVRVTIGDINDCRPLFLSLPYHTAVTKGTKKGGKIVQVHAVDGDYGVNGTVTYSSPDLPPLLDLNAKSGKITLKKTIDSTEEMQFTVTATDGGTPPLSTSTVVRVEVVDSMRPRFVRKEWKGRVERETTKGEGVLTLEARSEAEKATLVYTIDEGNQEGLFEIDMDTGVISVRESLFVSEKEEWDLGVGVVDAVRPAMRDQARVKIQLASSLPPPLSFSNRTFLVSINEETPSGTSLLSLALPHQEHLLYSLSGPNATLFRLDSSTGILSLASPLDYEEQRTFVLKATAQRKEGKESSPPAVATVVVEVLDENDESPVFVNSFASVSMADSARAGDFVTLMSVRDKDTVSSLPDGARLLYSVIDGDDTLFVVDKHSGVVRVGRDIEEEDLVERRKTMNVSVTDGLHTAFGRLTIDIAVSGLRSRTPRFEQSQYVVSMKESSMRSSSALTTVRAIGGVAPLHYSLGGGMAASWPVGMDHTTGKIHLKTKIERSQNHYIIPLIATDSLGRRAFSTLTLRIIDENSHPPLFALPLYSCSISAGAKSGESLVTISASDDDEGDSIEYALMGETKGLRIDERSGLISVGSESRLSSMGGSSLSLIVRATDGGNPPHSTSVPLTLNVVPSDVAIPRFANSLYRFTVAEDAAVGFLVGRVQQMANDVGEVRYEMQPASASLPFTVDKSGKILVQALLDREKQWNYRFVLVAHAAGGAHSLTTVSITIDDVNDNMPVFRGSYESISVREDAPLGTSIAVFSATDADVSSTGKLSFSLLESASSDVSLDSSSGWLSVASSLDRETRAEYSLTARVTDQGGKHTDLPFTLKVIDVNDEIPKFDEKNYTIRIDPSILADSQTIGRVTVKDADLPPNNITRLFIVKGNEDGLFSIDNSGRITVAERGTVGLVAAGTKSMDLEVLAHDGVHSSTATVTIISTPSASTTVECPPEDTVVRVKEDVEVGYALELSEPVKKATYSMVPSAPLPFAIDGEGGRVLTTEKLDREKTSQYSFTRRMTTSALECEERVRVEVEDVNEAPVFTKEVYEIGVRENEAATEEERVFLVRVQARDADAAEHGRVSYALAPHSDNAPFRLDAVTGVVTVVQPLDRETKDQYLLTVVATDGGEPKRSAKATVKISVADVNDVAPIWERKEYATRIMESESVGYEMLRMKAVGGDEGERVTYALVEGHPHNEYVEIGETSGVLKLRSPVDFEKDKSLVVRVRATDSGSPPLSTETTVVIEILDENDNIPRFDEERYEVTVSEDEKQGAVIGKVLATDADSLHFGTVEYSIDEISEGEEKEGTKKGKKEKKRLPFEIGRQSGEIRLSGKIDYEKTKEYHFEVRATDGGGRHSVVPVKVDIEDFNDNLPIFAECNLTAIAQKSVSAGHVLLTLSVSDADSAKYGGPPFTMQIEGEGADALSIDDRMNVVTTSKLAGVESDRLNLVVRATDKGGKSAECPLVVEVKEESTHPPKAKPLSIRLITLYGEYAGGDIGWVEGMDEDKEDSVRYALVEESIRSPGERAHQFRVDPEVGSLWAAPGILPGLHSLNVSLTDGKFYAYAPVHIEVIEIGEAAIDHTMVVRVESTVAEFYARHKKTFKATVANALNIGEEQIRILSVVEKTGVQAHRQTRSSSKVVDVAFIAYRRPKPTSGLMAPKQFYLRASSKGETGLKAPFSVQPELCAAKSCRGGECKDEVVFSDGSPRKYTIVDEEEEGVTSSLVVPPFERRRSCKCPQGKGGLECEEEVNGCARSRCSRHEMCVPLASGVGARVDCLCPPTTTGEKCALKDQRATPTVHVDGHAFFEVDLPVSLDQRMELAIEFRTTTRDGYLMYAEGESGDHHGLQIKSGAVAYSWESGRGVTSVESTIEVADGGWHTVWVARRGRSVEMRVDEGAKIMGEAPAGGSVVNLWRWSRVLVIGAKVKFNDSDPSIFERSRGLSACIRKIQLDGAPLVLTSNGLRLFAAKLGCRELAVSPCYGVNATAVCKNDGRCIPAPDGSFTCECSSSRYRGGDCSVDSDPCGLHTGDAFCPVGINCIPLEGRAQCQCPPGHTGEKCEKRDRDFVARPNPCLPNPCGSGTCLDMSSIPSHIGNANYICRCGDLFKNTQCDEEAVSAFFSVYAKELVVGVVAMLIIALVALIIYKFCRYRYDKKECMIYDDHVYTPHGVNPNAGVGGGGLPSTGHSTLIQPPPPLPPRTFRNGRPTIEVRPYAADERVGSSKGDSGESLNGSFPKPRKGLHRGTECRESQQEMSRSIDGDSSAMRDLEALRRIGLALPDDHLVMKGGSGGRDPPPPLHRRVRGRDGVSRGEALLEERLPLGDDWEAARSTPMTRIDHAVRNEQDRRRRQAAGGGGMRVEMSGNGKIAVADTLLSPVENDAEYMTMRPRGVGQGKSGRGESGLASGGSQKRPLLAAAEDDESSEGTEAPVSHRPPLPVHGEKGGEEDESMWQSRVYDDPHYDSSQMYRKSEATSNLIGDMDATDDEEAPPLPTEAPPTES